MMELTELDIQMLEGYWSNGLTAAEMSATRTRLEEDTDFREAASQYQEMALLLEMHRTQAWLAAQKNENRQNQVEVLPYPPTPNPTKPQPLTKSQPLTMKPLIMPAWVKVAAASVALAVGVVGYYYYSSQGPVEKFVDIAFDPPKPVDWSMSKLDEDKKNAVKHYADKEYDKAIPLLEKVTKADSKDSVKFYYLSLCYIAENKPQAAIPILKNMLNSEHAYQPEWFLALAYLKNKDYSTAKTILEEMAQSADAEYRKKAALGLEAIKEEGTQ